MKRFLKIFMTCFLIMALVLTPMPIEVDATTENPSMKITILNVEHGDAAVIESNGHFMVIDGGKYTYVDKVLNCLDKAGATKIDLVVSSHWDGDHVGGLNQVIRNYEVDTVWYSSYFVDNQLTQNVKNAIANNGSTALTPSKGTTYQVGDATVQVIADGKNATTVSAGKSEDVISNNSSLIVKVTCAGKSALFTGDARSEIEDKLSKSDVNCDILKLSHHGNYYSSSKKFIKKTSPEYAVASVGKNNTEGAPNLHITYNLSNAGVIFNRTDLQGDITYYVDSNGITMSTQKKAPDLTKAKIKKIKKTYRYTGKKIKPLPKVTLNGKKLYCRETKVCYTTTNKKSCYHYKKNCKSIKSVPKKYKIKTKVAKCEKQKKEACGWCVKSDLDYKITYTANKKVGTATITMTGLGENCFGTVTRTFKIKKKKK